MAQIETKGQIRKTDIGKIMPLPKANGLTSYDILDIVVNDGRAYISKKRDNQDPITDKESWMQITENTYDIVVRLGLFDGSETEWVASLSAASEEAARLCQEQTELCAAATEKANIVAESVINKADLDDKGYVREEQISPKIGKQTGVLNGTYRSSDNRLLPAGDKTLEFYFNLPLEAPQQTINIYLENYSEPTKGVYLVWYPAIEQLYCYCGGRSLASPVIAGGKYHAVISIENKVCSFYLNGKLVSSREAEEIQTPSMFLFIYTVTNGHHVRLFNRGLSPEQINILWNNGRPQDVVLSESGIEDCQAEYIPEGLLAESWRDTSGNHLDIQAMSVETFSPEMCYAPAEFPKSIIAADAPEIVPQFIGQEYYDTDGRIIYKAIGIASAADWLPIS